MPHSRRSRSKCAADDNAPRQRSQQDSGEASATRRTLPLVDVPDEESGDRKRTSLEVEGGEIGESSQAIKEKVERSQSSALPHGGAPEKAGPSSQLRTDSDGTGRHDGVQRRDLDSDCPRTEPSVQEFLANLKWRRLHQQNLTTTSNPEVRPPPAPPPSAVIRSTSQRGFAIRANVCSGSPDAHYYRECAARPDWSWPTSAAAINLCDSGICINLDRACRPFSNSPSSAVQQ